MDRRQVDITPHPRILQVLGEIEFKPWQCIAELVDNAIDQFVRMSRAGNPTEDPTVEVAFGRDTVLVKDNGPGMSIENLEMSVKAGWTSNERYGSLGLYGIGFNIATARLGNETTIWTTEVGSDSWFGLKIDLRKLAGGATYSLEVITRSKSDINSSGTEIEVTGIKDDWRDRISNNTWVKANVTERLSSIYATMLRLENPLPIHFSLRVNGLKVEARKHCVWPIDLTVYRKSEGIVRPIQEINVTLGMKYLVRETGELLDSRDGYTDEQIHEVPERVYGWIGIQKYADDKDFGIDILRNGRKIEVQSKDLFVWEDENGESESEYPIDDPRYRGRIVGEVHLDHGYVHYTKHRFEREHSSWAHLVSAISHREPLTKRSARGFKGVNESPLGILFRVFRRNSPAPRQSYKDILFLKDNEQAKTWAKSFRQGKRPYSEDSVWLKQLELDAAPPPKETEEGGGDTGPDIIIVDDERGSDPPQVEESEARDRTLIPELSMRISGIGSSGITYDFEVYDSSEGNADYPWRTKATPRGVYEIELNTSHDIFDDAEFSPRAATLIECANIIAAEELRRSTSEPLVLSGALAALRERHASSASLDEADLRGEIALLCRGLRTRIAAALPPEKQEELVATTNMSGREDLELKQARGPEDGSLFEFLEIGQLLELFKASPETLSGAGCFTRTWTPEKLKGKADLLDEYRASLVREIDFPMTKLVEFSDPLSPEFTPSALRLVRACIDALRDLISYGEVDG
jgi:hypothetical protein